MKFLRWIPLIALILSGFCAVYNQGVQVERRLATIETKLDMHLNLSQVRKTGTKGRVILGKLKYVDPEQ